MEVDESFVPAVSIERSFQIFQNLWRPKPSKTARSIFSIVDSFPLYLGRCTDNLRIVSYSASTKRHVIGKKCSLSTLWSTFCELAYFWGNFRTNNVCLHSKPFSRCFAYYPFVVLTMFSKLTHLCSGAPRGAQRVLAPPSAFRDSGRTVKFYQFLHRFETWKPKNFALGAAVASKTKKLRQ